MKPVLLGGKYLLVRACGARYQKVMVLNTPLGHPAAGSITEHMFAAEKSIPVEI